MSATTRILLCAAISMAISNLASAENWTRFRGPNGQGISTEKNLPTTWSADENVVWKASIPGKGWSSPIVYKDKVFVTTATEEGVSCRILCVNRKDGSIAWNTEVHRQKPGPMRQQNSYATPTPVTDGERVYSVFYDGTVAAVDFSGKPVWKSQEVKFFSLHGLGASPLLAQGQLIMPYDGSSREESRVGWKEPWKNAVILSLDAATGAVKWKGKRGESRVGHVTPILLGDGEQFVSAGGDRVQGHDAQTGKQVWSIYSQGEGVTPSPVIGDGLIYTSSGIRSPNDSGNSTRRKGRHHRDAHRLGAEERRPGPGITALCRPLPLHDFARQHPALHRSVDRRDHLAGATDRSAFCVTGVCRWKNLRAV